MAEGAGELVRVVSSLKRSNVDRLVERRMAGFKRLGRQAGHAIFKELCFCILTANYTAEGGIRIQRAVGNGFLSLPEKRLAARLRALGYRFPNTRARYIVKAREYAGSLKEIMRSRTTRTMRSFRRESAMREWFVSNIHGLGYKEASHFLRNIGYADFAIIDFHIIDLLARHRIIKKPKGALSKKRYLAIERVLQRLARKCNVSLGELDLYLWYLETGKVLK